MSLYLTRAKYSHEAFKGMIANPSDREAAGRAMFEAAGMKLHHMWYSGDGAVICIVEGNEVAGSAVTMVVLASGGFSDVESTVIITTAQMIEAMKGAGPVAAKFRPPGK